MTALDTSLPPALFDLEPAPKPLKAHCFWGACKHLEVGTDYWEVHDRMERHYADQHSELIDRLIGWMR